MESRDLSSIGTGKNQLLSIQSVENKASALDVALLLVLPLRSDLPIRTYM